MSTKNNKSKTTSNRTIDAVKIRNLAYGFHSFCSAHTCDSCPVNSYIHTLKLPNANYSCTFIYEHIFKDKVEDPFKCPFCGSETKIEDYDDYFYVECPGCGYSSPQQNTMEKAIDIHNKFCSKQS